MKSGNEGTLVESGGKQYATTKLALYKALGLSKATGVRMFAMAGNPGATGKGWYDVEAWRSFKSGAHTRVDSHPVNVDLTPEERRNLATRKAELESRKLEEQVRKLELERGEMEGNLISIEEAIRVFGELAAAVKDAQAAMHNNVAREMAGCEVPEATKIIKEASRGVLEKLALGEWAKKKIFWSKLYAQQSVLLAS